MTAGGASATDAVAVVIQADNDPPTADAGSDQTVAEGTAVTLAGSGTDPEGEALSYAWRQSGGRPTVALTGASTATPTFVAPELTGATPLTFELTVTAGGASATDAVAVVIQADNDLPTARAGSNDPPTANAGSDQTVTEGTAVTLTGSGTGPEGEALSYAWRQSGGRPTVALTGASTATPTFVAPELTGATPLTFELTVTAGGASATDAVAITVLPRSLGREESVPMFGDAIIADRMWTQNMEIPGFTLPTAMGGTGTVTYDLIPALPDGVILAATHLVPTATGGTGTVTDDPSPALSDGVTRAAAAHSVTGTPTVAQGETTYTWTATDEAGATATLPFIIVVAADLQPVFQEEVEAQRYRVGTAVSLTLPTATGGNGELQYALAPAPPSGLTFDPVTLRLSGLPAEAVARDDYRLTATDEDGDTATLTFTLEVVPEGRVRDLGLMLAGVGRTVATDAVDVLEGRFGSPALSRVQVILGGQVLRLTEEGAGTEVDAVSEDSAGSAAGARTGTWQRVTGLARGVARAFGVVIDGEIGQPRVDASSYAAPLEGEGRRSAWQSQERIQPVSGKELLARSAFELPLTRSGQDGVPALTLWGRGSAGGFSGRPRNDFTMEGTLYSGYVGLDYRPKPTVLLGLGVSHGTGNVNYERTAVSERGGMDVKLTSVFPYAHWQPRQGLRVWSMLGAGWGEMEVTLAGDAGRTRTTDLTSLMGAVGGRQALTTWQGIDLAAKTDAFLATLRSSGKTNLPGARGHAERVRLLVEGRTEWMPSAESRMQPRLELGGRWDSGTAEQGLGAEIGGGLAYTQTTWGLSVEAQGRYLVAHQAGAFEDWGASLNVRLDPRVAGQGAYLTVSPVWGQAASGVEQLWGSPGAITEDVVGLRPGTPGWLPQQFQVDVGYGLALSEGRGLMTPYGGLAIEGIGAFRYRLGGRLDLTSFLTLRLEGEHAKQTGQAATHGITLRLDW